MKHLKKYAFVSTLLLTGAVGFTACSSDSEVADVNPTFDGEAVKTQFAINVPTHGATTRMSAANTQQSGEAFLGINDLNLLSFGVQPSVNTSTAFKSKVGLSNSNTKDETTDAYRYLYSNVNIPLNTTHFVLYANRNNANTSATTTVADLFAKGILTNNLGDASVTTPASIKFTPKAVSAVSSIASAAGASDIIAALNALSAAEYNGTKWCESSDAELKTLYNNLKNVTGGSANTLKEAMKDFLSTLTGSETAPASVTDLKTQIASLAGAVLEKANATTLPQNLNLPDGVAVLEWSNAAPAVASYKTTSSTIGTVDNGLVVSDVIYPASLSYWVESPAMVSDTDLSASLATGWPTSADWKASTWTSASDFVESAVKATTRSIGVKNPLQYAVASLKTGVYCAAPSLEDNAKAKGETQDRQITVPAEGFTVTGVLIGGQPAEVGYDYYPLAAEKFEKTVYDNAVTNVVAKEETTPSTWNYTLVLDNKKADTQQKVRVAIELKNTAAEFWGADGIIPEGATFYLVGELDPTSITATGGDNMDPKRIFGQDFVTTAKFKISSLKNAYNGIPDLRATNLSIGLAVDLEWQAGLTFDIEL